MEIVRALLPELTRDAGVADAAIADFACRRRGDTPLPDGVGLRACSACAGDYEDPDRTARTERVVEDDDVDPRAPEDEFPVPRE